MYIWCKIAPVKKTQLRLLCAIAIPIIPLVGALMAGCAADIAMSHLQAASWRLFAQPQAVVRSDFPSADLSAGTLKQLKLSSPGSEVLGDALIAQANVREFVKDHGIPNGVVITKKGLQLDLMYADTSTVYVFALGDLFPAKLEGTRELTYVEQTAISPEAHWRRVANDLRVYLDDSVRLLRIGRRLLRVVPPQGPPARDPGFLVIDATPASAKLFGLPEDSRGVIVAYVDPAGPVAGILQPGDLLTALGKRRLSGVTDYKFDELVEQRADSMRLTKRRADAESSLEITLEALPFALDIHVMNTWYVNALAVPGLVVFTSGMLNFCDDNELAFVFGHELGHLAERQAGPRKVLAAMRKGGIAPGVIAPAEVWQLQTRLLLLNLGGLGMGWTNPQEQELLADRHGIEYAARAGYDPAAAIRFLERLKRREDVEPIAEFVKVHPPAVERLQQARQIIEHSQSPGTSL